MVDLDLVPMIDSLARSFEGVFGKGGDPASRFDARDLAPSRDPFGGLKFGAESNPFGGLWGSMGGQEPIPDVFGPGGAISRAFAAKTPSPDPTSKPGGWSGGGGGAGGGSSFGGDPSTGMTPGVAKWAQQTKQTFGDIQGLDPDTMLAIMTNESGGDPNAYNAAAPGGAWGLFQNVGLGSNDPNVQFQAAHQLAQQKMAAISQSYAAHGMNPDARTRARDFALAWAGHFDYGSGQPNPSSRDVGSGQTADQLTAVFFGNYDKIKAGRTQQTQTGTPTGGGDGTLGSIAAPWARKAESVLGMPYTNGGIRNSGNPADSFDCSSFAGWTLGIPRNLWNAQAQYDNTARIGAAQAQPGDRVFFQGTTDNDPSAKPVTHVGIYIGGGKMVQTGGAGGVMISDVNSDYWRSKVYGYGRWQGGTSQGR